MIHIVHGLVFAAEFGLSSLLVAIGLSGRLAQPLQLVDRSFSGPKTTILFALLTIGSFVWLSTLYIFSPVYLDHVEPQIASVAWLIRRHLPVHHPLHATESYSLLYGAAIYELNFALNWLFGPSIVASKLTGFAGLIALFFVYLTARRLAWNMLARIVVVGLIALFWLAIGTTGGPVGVAFWNRPDPIILLLTAIVAWASMGRVSTFNSVVIGLAGGILPLLKIHAIVYTLPLIGWYLWRKPELAVRHTLLIAASSLCSFALLLLPDSVSLKNYFAMLAMASHHGFDRLILEKNILVGIAILTAPVTAAATAWNSTPAAERVAIVLLAFSTAVITLLGAKQGAGTYHLMPLAIASALLTAAQLMRRPPALTGSRAAWVCVLFTLASLPMAAQNSWSMVRSLRAKCEQSPTVKAEITRLLSRWRGHVIEMGYSDAQGENYEDTFYRPLLVFAGQPVSLDGSALMDLKAAGASWTGSAALVQNCRVGVWLIPTRGEPFSLKNSYPLAAKDLFGADFRRAFYHRYFKAQSGGVFDAWVCSKP